jgi:hypothetical protein
VFIEPKLCENCGHDISTTAKFCAACGTAVPEKLQPKCPKCGTQVDTEAQHCDECSDESSKEIPPTSLEQPAQLEVESDTGLAGSEEILNSSVPEPDPEPEPDPDPDPDPDIDSEVATSVEPRRARRKSRKPLLAFISVVILGLLFAVVWSNQEPDIEIQAETSSNSAESTESPVAAEEPELPLLDLDKVFSDKELEEVALGICSPLEDKVLSKLSLKTYRSHMSDLGEVEDEYGARDFTANNSWVNDQFLSEYEADINGLLSKTLIENSKWDESKYQVDLDSWAGIFISVALKSCDLESLYEDTYLAMQDLQSEVDQVLKLAAKAPWYPKGFEEVPVDSSFAYGFDADGECDSLAEACAVFEIASQKACNELTLVIDFFDKKDLKVDSTIFILNSLKANRPTIVNVSSLEKSETFAIDSLSCK